MTVKDKISSKFVKLTWRHMHMYLALPGEVLVQVVFGHLR